MRNGTLGSQLQVLSASEALEIEKADRQHVFIQVRSEFIRDETTTYRIIKQGQLPLYWILCFLLFFVLFSVLRYPFYL